MERSPRLTGHTRRTEQPLRPGDGSVGARAGRHSGVVGNDTIVATMKILSALCLFTAVLSAQDQPANPLTKTSKAMFAISKGDVMGSVDAIPEDLWSFQPTKDVLGQWRSCSRKPSPTVSTSFAGAATTWARRSRRTLRRPQKSKAEIVGALKEVFAYCEAAYSDISDSASLRNRAVLRHEDHETWSDGLQLCSQHGALRESCNLHANQRNRTAFQRSPPGIKVAPSTSKLRYWLSLSVYSMILCLWPSFSPSPI